MKRLLILCSSIMLIVLSLATIVSCQQNPAPAPALTPAPVTEPAIPTNFTTYTSEGFFSISYPQDWSPAISVMEELEKETKAWIKNIDPEVDIEDAQMIFLAGKPSEEGWYPSVSIVLMPRTTGYYTLDEIFEAEDLWAREYSQKYRVYSQIRTMVDGREADITSEEDYEPETGLWRYTILVTVKDDFVWLVTCASESADYMEYEYVFNNIVRSLRILN